MKNGLIGRICNVKRLLWIMPIFLFFFNAEKNFACNCPEDTASPEDQIEFAFKDSTAIFSGEVITIKRHPKSDFILIVKFKLENFWKGSFVKDLIINTANGGTACGYRFETSKKYLVYAYGKRNDLSTTICTRTDLIENNKDVKILDKLKKQNNH